MYIYIYIYIRICVNEYAQTHKHATTHLVVHGQSDEVVLVLVFRCVLLRAYPDFLKIVTECNILNCHISANFNEFSILNT